MYEDLLVVMTVVFGPSFVRAVRKHIGMNDSIRQPRVMILGFDCSHLSLLQVLLLYS